ncbi:hypothetical protein ACFYWP_42125 [Actinacidiphila glaucinigra]|uniref:hypothetical protein n=1 Tax=Actinacidiphila glaucinigra TaxID=235986 RepID=UPI0036A1A54D
MTDTPPAGPTTFDDSTLEEIAAMVCGDDAGMKYRRGCELPGFLLRAGWDNVPDHDGPRLRWVHDLLRERNEDAAGDVEAVILRLADRREYQQDPKEYTAVIGRLQEVLALEGLRIAYDNTTPTLTTHEPGRPSQPQRVELKVAITDVVSDPDLARAVQLRLDEAPARNTAPTPPPSSCSAASSKASSSTPPKPAPPPHPSQAR